MLILKKKFLSEVDKNTEPSKELTHIPFRRCHIFSVCSPMRYLKVVFSSSSVSVAVDPMMILLRQYIYSQFQQLEQAFLSPLQILNSYTLASLIYQNTADLLSWRQLLPELLLTLTGISTVHHITHPPFKQTAVKQMLWPHRNNRHMWACYCTTDRLSAPALSKAAHLFHALKHIRIPTVSEIYYSKEKHEWLLAHQKKLNPSLPTEGGLDVIRKQMVGTSIHSTTLRKKWLDYMPRFLSLNWSGI